MIAGHGIDIVEINRIEKLIAKYNQHFLSKVFTENEITYCNSMAHPAIHFSGRWAVKEAFYKAVPSHIQELSTWKAIEVVPPASGGRKPEIHVCARQLAHAFSEENILSIHVSISHEKQHCIASVILEK